MKHHNLTSRDISVIFNVDLHISSLWKREYNLQPCTKIGREFIFNTADLLEFFENQIATSKAPATWRKHKQTLLEYLKKENNKPKYDPCRKFQIRDKVQVVEKDGRIPTCFPVGKIKVGDILTVIENEGGDVFIKVKTADGSEMMAPWFHLALVTPAEEIEPYSVYEHSNFMVTIVQNDNETIAMYPYFTEIDNPHGTQQTYEQARARAHADCVRLNEEWRKEEK